ncbi:hypothetical protein [Paractinoplanes brasiliensis]|uniref:Uncharacterized protein n=1 Tax=Paractinoplanes brasiliensis TaxID=52695 RepID=A0A4V3C644_9ACTN|nr:hypothetical protein [Actinoplanes brasiliensis]TDO32318.1 hypothetical protein C8E87_7775 [Actinoplanes brasiliensis]GID27815.1 hypothetical protein Abr02nite_27980 [Actinoplanes brasiliensis]
MTDPGPALGGSLWTAPDEFRGRLIDLAGRALRDDPGLQSALSRWKDELLQSALLDSIAEQADTLLARTNREIDDVVAKRRALDAHTTDPPPSIAGQAGRRRRRRC